MECKVRQRLAGKWERKDKARDKGDVGTEGT